MAVGFDSVLVVVNCFTEMAHFILVVREISGNVMEELFLINIVQLHGLSDYVISHHGPQFIFHF